MRSTQTALHGLPLRQRLATPRWPPELGCPVARPHLAAGGTLDIIGGRQDLRDRHRGGPLPGITINGVPTVYSVTDGITADPAVQAVSLPALGPGDLAAHPGAVITLVDGGTGPALNLRPIPPLP